jgi:hypothetical protein
MTSNSRVALLVALGLASTAPGRRAAAQSSLPTAQDLETARSLYKQGKELRASGDAQGALEKFQAAHALGNTPVTGIELARTYVTVGRIVEAREICLSLARMPVASDETVKSAEARIEAAKLADDLRPRIPTLVVRVGGLAPGESARVSIDGAPVPAAAVSEPQKVNPGKHGVVARAGEGPSAREADGALEVSEGQAAELELTFAPVLPAPPPPPPQSPAPRLPLALSVDDAFPMAAKVGFATMLVAGSAGVVAGLVAIEKKGLLDKACNHDLCDSHGGTADLATAYSWATASNVGFAVAGVGLAAGVAGLLSRGHPARAQGGAAQTLWIGLGAAGIHGRF